MKSYHIGVFCVGLLALGWGAVADATTISAKRSDIWDAANKVVGNNVVSAISGGETWQFNHVSASDFSFNSNTTFSPQNLTPLFGSTFAGDFDSGMGQSVSYVTLGLASGSTFGTQLNAIDGFGQVNVSGSISPWTTTGAANSFVDMAWKLVAFDASLSAYNILSDGGFRATSLGATELLAFSNLTGDGVSVNANVALDTGDWIGIFYQKTGQNNAGGTHFNFLDNEIIYTMDSYTSVFEPSVVWLFGVGLISLIGGRARKKTRT